jgi:hypothetical protein
MAPVIARLTTSDRPVAPDYSRLPSPARAVQVGPKPGPITANVRADVKYEPKPGAGRSSLVTVCSASLVPGSSYCSRVRESELPAAAMKFEVVKRGHGQNAHEDLEIREQAQLVHSPTTVWWPSWCYQESIYRCDESCLRQLFVCYCGKYSHEKDPEQHNEHLRLHMSLSRVLKCSALLPEKSEYKQ